MPATRSVSFVLQLCDPKVRGATIATRAFFFVVLFGAQAKNLEDGPLPQNQVVVLARTADQE